MTALSYKSKLVAIAAGGKHNDVKVDPLSLTKLILWVDTLCTYRGERELRSLQKAASASKRIIMSAQTSKALSIGGTRTTGQSIRTQNGNLGM